MSCTAAFWLYSLGSLLIGGLLTWLFLRNKIRDLYDQISSGRDKVLNLENEYSSLRASSQEQILALKDEKEQLRLTPLDKELNKKYDKLKIENQNLQSQIHQLKRAGKAKNTTNQSNKDLEILRKSLSKAQFKIDDLLKEKAEIKKDIKKFEKISIDNKKSEKLIKKLEKEIKDLKDKLKKNKKSKSTGVEKRVEIIKSLRTKKLKDWLNRDKAYKVSKKVSTSKIKDK